MEILNRVRFSYLVSIFFIIALLLFSPPIIYGGALLLEQDFKISNRGVWVTCFSEKRILYSKEAVRQLIEFCKKAKINEIYLQLYRGGDAYYDSKITDRSKYKEMLKAAGTDVIDFLLDEAAKNKIKVFAWVNVLSIAQNKKADIITKFDDTVLTRDQYLRPSSRSEGMNETDRYYLRDEQLFLEPGDPRVVKYTLSIVDEIISGYPLLSGIHLDYIRYPNPIPFLPDSRFNEYGLSYGYGKNNITRFKEKTNIDPLKMKNERDNILHWDNWKRDQITSLVKDISMHVKNKFPNMLISCAVGPSPIRAYSISFQDWSFWLEEGIVDYVVLMNYTRDNRLVKETTKSALAHRGKGKIYVGIGVFLMKDEPELLSDQYKLIVNLRPDGIAFFAYDEMRKIKGE